MRIEDLRKMTDSEEIDYQFLMSALKSYSHPRDKISGWLKSGELIRVKKGLYVFGQRVAQGPYSREILANLIYGPSAISLTYALAYYGLIPERVELVTSVTNKRNKLFSTPAGNFIYYYLQPKKYAVGIDIKNTASDRQFIIASPEKALCDQIYIIDKEIDFHDMKDVEAYLFYDLRIDENEIKNFNIKKLEEICNCYEQKKLNLLLQFFKKWKH